MANPTVAARCAVHPGRAARDLCPVCGRPRCDDDLAAYAERGCAACLTQADETPPRPPVAAFIATALTIVPVAVVGGWIYSQYVEVHIFSWLVPMLIGVAGSSPGSFFPARWYAAWPMAGRVTPVVGVVAGVLGTAFGFRLFPHGPHDPLHPVHEVAIPYICAAVGALVWPLVLGPPKRPDAPLA